MQIYNKQVATAQALSASSNSAPLQLMNMFGFAIQAVITGTPTGAFKLQGSADPIVKGLPSEAATAQPANWTDIDNSSVTVSAAGSILWNISDCMYNWVRVVYTDASSGSSTATAAIVFNGKGM